ncbi:CPBP family intramembrane metalloprotease domain-containing protein [Maritimibacter sp. 55A14]|nr:CPBP family intramembrane metalloprotease domain-containing protein [Maritimibacter sp. 55A14]
MVAPARLRPQIWRLIVGLILAAAIYAAVIALAAGSGWVFGGTDALRWFFEGATGKGSAPQTLVLLITFAGLALGTAAAARLLHKRRAATLFGPDPARTRRDALRCFAVVFAVLTVSVVIAAASMDFKPNLPLSAWLLWLAPAFALLILQVSAEEMIFRGYVQTQLAARFRSPLVWMVLPAAVFGLAHFNPMDAGANAWVIVGAAALFGLIAADLTAQSGNLGAAIGFHLANNVFAVLIVAVDGTITGLSLYLTPFSADEVMVTRPMLIQDGLMMILAWALCRLAIRR